MKLFLPYKSQEGEHWGTTKLTAEIQVQTALEVVDVGGDGYYKEVYEDHHELKITSTVDQQHPVLEVNKVEVLKKNEDIDETANLKPDCKMRVENIEQSVGVFNILPHVAVEHCVHEVDHADHDDDNNENNNIYHSLSSCRVHLFCQYN